MSGLETTRFVSVHSGLEGVFYRQVLFLNFVELFQPTTSYDEYLHYECIIQTLFVKPTVRFLLHNTFYTVPLVLTIILESELSAWSLKFLVTDKIIL